jgi:iron complex outermembrane receptor protein
VCQVNTTLNLGNAEVDGFDLSLATQPTSSLSLGAAVSYMDARYSTNLPGPNDTIIRRKGEPLAVSPWSMHLSGEYVFDVHEHDLYVRTDYTHTTHNTTPVDTNSPLFDPDIPRAPATSELDLRAGARVGGLDVSLFANNVLDNHPLLSFGHDTVGDVNYRSTTFRPRTVGITATFRK